MPNLYVFLHLFIFVCCFQLLGSTETVFLVAQKEIYGEEGGLSTGSSQYLSKSLDAGLDNLLAKIEPLI